jgi:hypothetical protein
MYKHISLAISFMSSMKSTILFQKYSSSVRWESIHLWASLRVLCKRIKLTHYICSHLAAISVREDNTKHLLILQKRSDQKRNCKWGKNCSAEWFYRSVWPYPYGSIPNISEETNRNMDKRAILTPIRLPQSKHTLFLLRIFQYLIRGTDKAFSRSSLFFPC